MKTTTRLLTIVLALALSLSSCSVVKESTCESVATILHDTALYLCSNAIQSNTATATSNKFTLDLIDVQLKALAQLPETPQRDDLILRLSTAKIEVKGE
jgi:hypothetical protein